MKKILAILLSAAALAGCSKKDDNIDKSDPALRDFAATAKLKYSAASFGNYLDSATLKIFNKDIVLDSAINNPTGNNRTCMYISLWGRFMNQNKGVSPKFIQGLQAIPAKTEVEIFQGTTEVSNHTIRSRSKS